MFRVKSYIAFDTDLGQMVATTDGKCVDGVYLEGDKNFVEIPDGWENDESNLLLNKAKTQILEYLGGSRKYFELPLKMNGTNFQKRVWSQLSKIPYGDTVSYQEVAEKSGNPKAFRAVGTAVGKNPLCIIVPCHRVLAKNGIGGYASGVGKKIKILDIESHGKLV